MKNNYILKGIIISIAIIFCIIIVFVILNNSFSTETTSWLNGGDWAGIIIGAISSGATLFLGYVSFWQNKMQREDNIRAENRLREQYSSEKESAENQRKIDVLVSNLNSFTERLHDINLKFLEKNFDSEVSYICSAITDSIDFDSKIAKNTDKISIADDKVGSLITFLNFIYNSIVYTKYYVSELDDCATNLVIFRHSLEAISLDYISTILYSDKDETKIDIQKLEADIKDLTQKYLKATYGWNIYFQESISHAERITYKNNIYSFFEWFENSNEKVGLLRTKITTIETISINDMKRFN